MPFRLLRLSALCVASASLLVGQQVSAQMDFPFEGNWVNPKTGGEGRIVWNSEENRYDILLIRPGTSNVPASCNTSKPGDVTSYIIPSKIEGGNPVFVYSWCKWNKDRVVTSRTWRKGTVFLRRSNGNLIVTSIGRYERIGSLASDGGYKEKPLIGRRRLPTTRPTRSPRTNKPSNPNAQDRGRPTNNVAQNKQAADALKEVERRIGRRLTYKERRLFHNVVGRENNGYNEMVEEGLNLFE